ncbi:MAG: hypothetical protein M3P23_14745, partial [Actinomycetota bacterium]|nr:hypothetical protein [Actinomycetota bacterium]
MNIHAPGRVAGAVLLVALISTACGGGGGAKTAASSSPRPTIQPPASPALAGPTLFPNGGPIF